MGIHKRTLPDLVIAKTGGDLNSDGGRPRVSPSSSRAPRLVPSGGHMALILDVSEPDELIDFQIVSRVKGG